MMPLYEIPVAWQEIQELLEASAGEITPEIEAVWAKLEEEGPAKIEAACCVLAAMKAEAGVLAEEIGRLSARKAALEGAQDRLRALVLPAVQALGGKVKGTKFTAYTTTRKNVLLELRPGVDVWDLPARFYRTREPELCKTELKKFLDTPEADLTDEAREDLATVTAALEIQRTESVSLGVR